MCAGACRILKRAIDLHSQSYRRAGRGTCVLCLCTMCSLLLPLSNLALVCVTVFTMLGIEPRMSPMRAKATTKLHPKDTLVLPGSNHQLEMHTLSARKGPRGRAISIHCLVLGAADLGGIQLSSLKGKITSNTSGQNWEAGGKKEEVAQLENCQGI